MTNPNEIKPVFIKRGGQVVASLRFNATLKQVAMDPVNVADLTLRDFTRIHSFFRRVQAVRYNEMQEQAQVPQTLFKDLSLHTQFKSSVHPHATLCKVGHNIASISTGHVVMDNGRYTLSSGVILVDTNTPVEPQTWTRADSLRELAIEEENENYSGVMAEHFQRRG